MLDPSEHQRALRPKGREKWSLIYRAIGTTNALQPWLVESRMLSSYARVHPRDREPGPLGPNWSPIKRKNGEDNEGLVAALRVSSASLYSSWERCSRFCSDDDLAEHEKKCRAARFSLRNHPSITASLQQFWDAIVPHLPPPRAPGKPPTCDLENFILLQQRFHKALVSYSEASGKGYEAKVARACAIHDWELDLNPEEVEGREDTPVMRQKTFLDSVFNVVDTWTLGTTPTEYAAFANALFSRVTEPESDSYISPHAIEQVDIAPPSSSYDVFKQASDRRPAPRVKTVYTKTTANIKAANKEAEELESAKKAAAEEAKAKLAMWEAKFAEMRSGQSEKRSTAAAAMAAAGTAPRTVQDLRAMHDDRASSARRAPGRGHEAHQRPRPPAGAQPVSHSPTPRRAPADLDRWFARAQERMREDSQRGGGRACGAWNALPPSSPRALHTSSPRGAHTLRHGGYAEPQHRPTKGMLTGATLGWQQVAQAVPATSGGSSPRPPSSMSAASRTQPLPSRPETQTPPQPPPQPPSPPARERGNSFFFTALTAAAALEPDGTPAASPSPGSPGPPGDAAEGEAFASPPGTRAPLRDDERPMTAPLRAYAASGGIEGKYRHPAAAYIMERSFSVEPQ